jgi:predicted DNA binding CopG/RHH family protein
MKKKEWKAIEKNWSKIPSLSPKVIAQIAKRNQELRSKKEARVTMRMNANDLARLKTIAEEQGLKYQTLIGAILKEYIKSAS